MCLAQKVATFWQSTQVHGQRLGLRSFGPSSLFGKAVPLLLCTRQPTRRPALASPSPQSRGAGRFFHATPHPVLIRCFSFLPLKGGGSRWGSIFHFWLISQETATSENKNDPLL